MSKLTKKRKNWDPPPPNSISVALNGALLKLSFVSAFDRVLVIVGTHPCACLQGKEPFKFGARTRVIYISGTVWSVVRRTNSLEGKKYHRTRLTQVGNFVFHVHWYFAASFRWHHFSVLRKKEGGSTENTLQHVACRPVFVTDFFLSFVGW